MQEAATFSVIVGKAIEQIRPVGTLLVGLALVYFLYGLAQFVLNAADESKREEGKKTMIWGIIALFVMVALWGLAIAVSDTFRLRENKVDKVDLRLP